MTIGVKVLSLSLLASACARPPEPSEPYVLPISSKGVLSGEAIRKTVRASFSKFGACYSAGLGRDVHLSGRVATTFVIEIDGSVGFVGDADGTTMPDETVSECVRDTFRTLVFPRPRGGEVIVTYPLTFSP